MVGCEKRALFDRLWEVYVSLNPSVERIKRSFEEAGETVFNDHIAFRTFSSNVSEHLGITAVSARFERLGYKAAGDYLFPSKHLVAKHFEVPGDMSWPKVFVSELDISNFSNKVKSLVESMLGAFDPMLTKDPFFCCSGRAWDLPRYEDYEALRAESEYAAWMSVFGHVPNHFTVRVNELRNFNTLESVNSFVEQAGFKLNGVGGKIKGSAEVYLEQSSTQAESRDIQFEDGVHAIPSVFYEFALRHPMNDKKDLFEGFIAGNADKIFESTNKKS